MTELQMAKNVARQAHASQIEESTGDPYVHHLARVAALVEGPEAQAVAWLHDILEDTPMTEQDLRDAGIRDHIVEAVVLLTRLDAWAYTDYIEALQRSGNALALAVKIADLRDHLRPNCPVRLRRRYELALRTLAPVVPAAAADEGRNVSRVDL